MELDDYEVGAKYLFHGRMIYLGEVVSTNLLSITITKCSWMGEMGIRMADLLSKGPKVYTDKTRIEVAPPKDEIILPRGAFAAFPWRHALPTESRP